jgi:hypothetical protein
MIRSDRRAIRRSLQRINRADGIRCWCGNADDALLCLGATRRGLYASLRPRLFRGICLWMACRNVAVRPRRVCVGVRSAAKMDRSSRERLGSCRRRSGRRRPSGAVREADVIDSAAARLRSTVRHIEKSFEGVVDPNVLVKCAPIDDSLRQACVDDRETNDVDRLRSTVCER